MKLAHTDTNSAVHHEPSLLTLDVEDISTNRRNPRSALGDLAALVLDIKANGILQPLVVTETDDHSYLLVAGHRRLAAAMRAGLHEVPAIMRTDLAEPIDQLATMIGENAARSDLTVVDEARGFQSMLDLGMTQAQVAKRTGRKAKYIREHLPAASATDEQKELINAGKITLEDLAGLEEFKDDPETRSALEQKLGTYDFGWQLARARARRRDEATAAAAAAKLKADGIIIITNKELREQEELDGENGHPGDTWAILDDKPEDAADDEVRAEIEIISGEPSVTWYRRTDPAVEPDDTPESEHERANHEARAALQQQRDDLATAAHLRAVHLHGQILAAKTADGETTLRHLIQDAAPGTSSAFHRNAALLGFASEDDPGTRISEDEYTKRRDAALNRLGLPQLAQALYLIRTEFQDRRLLDANAWQADGGDAWSAARTLDWRAELADTWGYVPAPVEQQIIDEDRAARGAEDDAGNTDGE